MNSPSKIGAKKDQFVGSVKENAGHVVGNESLEAEGQAQHATGGLQEIAATVQSYVQGTTNQVAGTVKGVYNSLTGDSSAEACNKVQEKKGEAEKKWNN